MIHVEGLEKAYGPTPALIGISLDVKEGECYGIIGPNGAGKTTLLNILATLVVPDDGIALVDGLDVVKEAKDVKKRIGVVFQDETIDDKLTGRENLELFAVLYAIPSGKRKEVVERIIKIVGLEKKADTLTRQYSGGLKRRVEIAKGLLGGPKVLILDEPSAGLDPAGKEQVWNHIKSLGSTVIVSTNDMEEALQCDRIGIFNEGQLVLEGSPLELIDDLGGMVAVVETGDLDVLIGRVHDLAIGTRIIKGRLMIVAQEDKRGEIIHVLEGVPTDTIDIHRPNLKDVFIYYTGHDVAPSESKRKGKGKGLGKRKGMGRGGP